VLCHERANRLRNTGIARERSGILGEQPPDLKVAIKTHVAEGEGGELASDQRGIHEPVGCTMPARARWNPGSAAREMPTVVHSL
jgi:hypothetical protein